MKIHMKIHRVLINRAGPDVATYDEHHGSDEEDKADEEELCAPLQLYPELLRPSVLLLLLLKDFR
jgi:hypothetical protein